MLFPSIASAAIIDSSATTETAALYTRLKNNMGQKPYFGQMQFLSHREPGATAAGDVHDLVGRYPMVMGEDYDFTQVSEPMTATKEGHILQHYDRGGIVTISWHIQNFIFNSDNNDKKSLIQTAVFTGSGLNDLTKGGTYTLLPATFTVVIDGTGSPNTFKWKKDTYTVAGAVSSGSYTTGVSITGASQTLQNGVTVTFGATTGHTLNDQWVIRCETPVEAVLPGGTYRTQYLAAVDAFSTWIDSRVGSDGKKIPILFRPYHENDGSWYWWGQGTTTNPLYQQLWQDLVTRVRDTNGVHNIIWVYAPGHYSHVWDFEDFWPGTDYVDVIGIDLYVNTTETLATDHPTAPVVTPQVWAEQAYDKSILYDKIFAITEGFKNIDPVVGNQSNDWWTAGTFDVIFANNKIKNAAYILVWNTGEPSYSGYRYCPSVNYPDGFVDTFNTDRLVFLGQTNVSAQGVTLQGVTIN